jgi:arginine decarboxylase
LAGAFYFKSITTNTLIIMNIHVTSGLGTGPTKLSAFDSALNHAGVANYNLLRLSSVIPPKTKIIVHDDDDPVKNLPGEWGDKLYVVTAEQRADTPNQEAWAGVGWVQEKKSGKGLFVEHEGNSEEAVRRDITQSLEGLMATRNVDFGEISMKVVGRTCTSHPVCALVIAVYKSEGWD